MGINSRRTMQKITVLLAIQPRMLSEVIQRLVERQPDMELVKEGSDASELRFAIKATEARVIILTPTDSEEESGICHDLLAEYPRLRIIALSPLGDTAFLYKSGSRPKRMDDVGEEAILSAIREWWFHTPI
jgi:DNA-binding NarL/FixJ family response regulator